MRKIAHWRFAILLILLAWPSSQCWCAESTEDVSADLLVIGGSESAVAAAVQAARLGVGSIALVNDIDWLGGQFTAEGLGAVDEWTIYKGRRTYFPRSGQFLEIMDAIEADMQRKYGLARPGNSFCAWTTCEPRDTERLFRRFVSPYLKENGGPLVIYENYEPTRVIVENAAVHGVVFQSVSNDGEGTSLTVHAKLTIDASDWGDVIRLSGAKYMRGPDLKSEFHEPSAPSDFSEVDCNELNPITYCMILRESETPSIIEQPPNYDERRYFGTTKATLDEYTKLGWPKGTLAPWAAAWIDSTMSNGPYGETPTVYTHRRLVDRRHNQLAAGSEVILVNWPLQDYPTYNFPKHLVDRLEAAAPGASQKNLIDMSPRLRRLVFEDAKHHALGMLYHLQTTVHDKQPDQPVSFRMLKLTDEFGTPDRLPLKPYVREALRMDALYVMREQDVRDADGVQSWAQHIPPDNVFGFQFNIDFHPTRRIFLDGDNAGPWAHIHSKFRNWGTHTDRSGFPLRGLVPREMDGLLGAGKNLGYTSIVSSAVRLHGHGMHAGQASATIAAVCLQNNIQPRDVAGDGSLIRRVQTLLVDPPSDRATGKKPPGTLLWPYQDVPPDSEHFVAVNQLGIRAILPGDPGLQDFQAERIVTRREVARAVARAVLSTGRFDRYESGKNGTGRSFKDVAPIDPDFAAIESLAQWKLLPKSERFEPDRPAAVGLLRQLFEEFGGKVEKVAGDDAAPLSKARLATLLWRAIATSPDKSFLTTAEYLTARHDADGDGLPDLDDPLPLDRDNDSLPDQLAPDKH